MKWQASWACSGEGDLAGADRPDRLVGDHDLVEVIGVDLGQVGLDLMA